MAAKEKQEREDVFRFAELARLEDELYEAEKESGVIRPPAWWQRLGDKWFEAQENRTRHRVKKRTYLILTGLLGWAGIHRFYEKRWKLGLLYLLFCWTGLAAASAVVDFLIAAGLPSDQEGFIIL